MRVEKAEGNFSVCLQVKGHGEFVYRQYGHSYKARPAGNLSIKQMQAAYEREIIKNGNAAVKTYQRLRDRISAGKYALTLYSDGKVGLKLK